jgi:hypothetical protein
MLQQTQVDRVLPKYTSGSTSTRASRRWPCPRRRGGRDVVPARLQHPAAAAALDRARIGRALRRRSCRPTRRRCCRSRASAPTRPAPSAASRSAARGDSRHQRRARAVPRVRRAGDPKAHAMRATSGTSRARVLPMRHVFDFNQALMDLGATVCTARNPNCAACPMRVSRHAPAERDPPRRLLGVPGRQVRARGVAPRLPRARDQRRTRRGRPRRRRTVHRAHEYPIGSWNCTSSSASWPAPRARSSGQEMRWVRGRNSTRSSFRPRTWN